MGMLPDVKGQPSWKLYTIDWDAVTGLTRQQRDRLKENFFEESALYRLWREKMRPKEPPKPTRLGWAIADDIELLPRWKPKDWADCPHKTEVWGKRWVSEWQRQMDMDVSECMVVVRCKSCELQSYARAVITAEQELTARSVPELRRAALEQAVVLLSRTVWGHE